MIELRQYQLEDESTPVTEWLRNLKDLRAPRPIGLTGNGEIHEKSYGGVGVIYR